MDRSIDRGLDFIKAKLTRLRQLVARRGKNNKPLIERLTPQELSKLTPNQMLILEMARKKDAYDEQDKHVDRSEYCESYDDYNDCHGDYYDAEYK